MCGQLDWFRTVVCPAMFQVYLSVPKAKKLHAWSAKYLKRYFYKCNLPISFILTPPFYDYTQPIDGMFVPRLHSKFTLLILR